MIQKSVLLLLSTLMLYGCIIIPSTHSPVKNVSIYSCAHVTAMTESNRRSVDDFFKVSEDLIRSAGYEVEIKNLAPSSCSTIDSFVGETKSGVLSVMIRFFPSGQTLGVQSYIVPIGQSGRYFVHDANIGEVRLAVQHAIGPIVRLLNTAEVIDKKN